MLVSGEEFGAATLNEIYSWMQSAASGTRALSNRSSNSQVESTSLAEHRPRDSFLIFAPKKLRIVSCYSKPR